MTITCRTKVTGYAWLLLFPLIASAQSLEDKVSQARKLQAQSMLDEEMADSMFKEKRTEGLTPLSVQEARRSAKEAQAKEAQTQAEIDSVLSEPSDSANALLSPEDSLALKDTTLVGKLKRKLKKKPLPKRYEQRIFGNLDRSAFSSAGGAAGRDYVLGPGDEVTVALWGDKEKEYHLLLNKEGKIFLEGIGLVPIAGQNLDQASQTLKQRLSKVYSGINRGTTHVDLSLGRTGPIRVFVLGEVKVPGGFVFTGHTSPLSAMYFAKGPTDIGTVRSLTLTRSGNKFDLDLYKYLLQGESLSPDALQDGDILFAGRAHALVEVDGDVGRPATYELKKGEGVKEALQFAGGLNPTAADHKLTLRRIYPGGQTDVQDLASPQKYLSGEAKLDLQDGDKLLVEKSTEQSKNFITISGPVKYPGAYEATGITSVNQLVAKAGGLREDAYLGRVHIVRYHPDGSSSLMAYSLDTVNVNSITLLPKDNVLLYSVKDMYIPDSVQISGAIFNPGRYEFRQGMTAKDLVMQAGGYLPHHESGKLLVFRGNTRERKVESIPLTVSDDLSSSGQGFALKPNDFVQVPEDPRWYKKEVVTLDGLFLHPGKYALLYPGEKLTSVVERAGGFKENGYIQGGRFYRSKDSVGRVGVNIEQAVRKPKSKSNISLVGGDSIFVPERLNTVKVLGEVGFETSVLYKEGASVQYYIDKAGGFTRRSEKDRVVVQYANGETGRDGYFNRKPDAGSTIYVPQGPEPKPVDWFAGVNALLSTMGVVLAVILSIQAIESK